MRYKALGFDYGGVIGGIGVFGNNFTDQVCEVLNISPENYRKVYFSHNRSINTGKITTWRDFLDFVP